MSYVEKLEGQRRAALDSRDAVRYFRLCNDLGISEHSVEAFDLYERGELDSQRSRRADSEDGSPAGLSELGYDVAKVASVALRRFPELEPGEKIGVLETKKVLGEIRESGFPVKPYSKMNAKEAWKYLTEIRREVAVDAREYCPSVLEKITSANDSRRRDAVEFR